MPLLCTDKKRSDMPASSRCAHLRRIPQAPLTVASPHRLVHLLLHGLRLVGTCLPLAPSDQFRTPSSSSPNTLSLRLEDRDVPVICHVALPVLELVHHSSRCSPFVAFFKGLSGNPPGGRRASCVHQVCDASVACSTKLVVPQRSLTLRLLQHRFLPVRWYPQPLVDILRIKLFSAPRRTSRCSRRSAVPSPTPTAPLS